MSWACLSVMTPWPFLIVAPLRMPMRFSFIFKLWRSPVGPQLCAGISDANQSMGYTTHSARQNRNVPQSYKRGTCSSNKEVEDRASSYRNRTVSLNPNDAANDTYFLLALDPLVTDSLVGCCGKLSLLMVAQC